MATVPAPDFTNLTDAQVWEQLHAGMVDSNTHKQAVLTLQLRNLERQTAATQQLATFTSKLTSATRALVVAAVVTALIAFAQLTQMALTYRLELQKARPSATDVHVRAVDPRAPKGGGR